MSDFTNKTLEFLIQTFLKKRVKKFISGALIFNQYINYVLRK